MKKNTINHGIFVKFDIDLLRTTNMFDTLFILLERTFNIIRYADDKPVYLFNVDQ